MTKKICLTCSLLEGCSDTSVIMLLEVRGCGSWAEADAREVDARVRAREIAGTRALEAMIRKGPPKKPAKDYRR